MKVFEAKFIKEELNPVIDVIKKGDLGFGPNVLEFENEFYYFSKKQYNVATNSASAAASGDQPSEALQARLTKLTEENKVDMEQLSKEKKKKMDEMAKKYKGSPDDLAKDLSEMLGVDYVE